MRRDEVEELVADGDDAQFLVCLDGPDAPTGHPEGDGENENDDENGSPVDPVGAVTLSRLDGDRPSIGYWLLPERRGEGFGEEAAALLLDHAFRTCDVHGVEAGAFDYNDPSRALLESLGFVGESRRREAWFVDGAYRDEVVYGLLREEWADRSIE